LNLAQHSIKARTKIDTNDERSLPGIFTHLVSTMDVSESIPTQ
jgi:hypothetical protein